MSEETKELIRDTIRETVNGKVDKLNKSIEELRKEVKDHNIKHEADMEEMKPFMQGAAGLGLLWKGLVAFGSLAVAYTALKNFHP